jgi:hypothetical protein
VHAERQRDDAEQIADVVAAQAVLIGSEQALGVGGRLDGRPRGECVLPGSRKKQLRHRLERDARTCHADRLAIAIDRAARRDLRDGRRDHGLSPVHRRFRRC